MWHMKLGVAGIAGRLDTSAEQLAVSGYRQQNFGIYDTYMYYNSSCS